ncbi:MULTISPECIES: hypothetical protein [Pseudomonas]|uniref:hypothetical protein n=1 Tax=Pseudomonas TaxID=286 RepID=UPI000C888F9A|nr:MULTISPECIES: hypothetical protein [Pseudomonas]PMY39314.1 hypothetical protein C1Y36_25675 [Pseudomonas sp. FW306-2-2C-D06C]PYC37950.1 hypothetical protein DMW99_10490 [Pseudomonas chlororaphis]
MRISEFYKLDRNQSQLDFVDVRLETDVPVFLDPTAIKSLESPWGNELSSLLQSFFETVLLNIKGGKDQVAQALLASLSERNEFHLGYSKGKSQGHAFGVKSAETVWGALSKSNASLTGLLEDLEDTCLLIEGVGPDMVSDAVSNILRGPLIKYTQDMCAYYGIPMSTGVVSGPIWDPVKGKWIDGYVTLPIAGSFGKVIFVPKILVRQKLSYKVDEYYRHYLLPEMQMAELKARTSLVEVLRDGRERVTKKALMDKYGSDKLAIVNMTLKYPHALEDYREAKRDKSPPPLSHEAIADVESVDKPDWNALKSALMAIPTGNDSATAYENIIEKIFSSLFYPSLCNPTKQHSIHDGRKRVDITYTNEAKVGFFHWVGLHYPSSMIFVECKNYGKELGNPEVDQLSSRFSPRRGTVGILTCRTVQDKSRLAARCHDTATDSRGYIIVLDDEDVCALVDERLRDLESCSYALLRSKFMELIS